MGTKKQPKDKAADPKAKQETAPVDTTASSEMVVAKFAQHRLKNLWNRGGKYSWVVIGLVLLAIAAAVIGVNGRDLYPPQTGIDTSNIPQDYVAMTTDDMNKLLLKNIGVDLDYLKTHDVSKKLLRNFNGAYIAARALNQTGQTKKGLQAYAIADSQAEAKNNTQFHQDYASAALYGNELTVWKAQLLKIRATIEKSTIPAAAKKEKLAQIDLQLRYGGKQ